MGLLRGEPSVLNGTLPEWRSCVEGGLLRKRELTRLTPLQALNNVFGIGVIVWVLLSFREEFLLPLKRLELSEMTPNWPESNPWSFPVLSEQITFPLSYYVWIVTASIFRVEVLFVSFPVPRNVKSFKRLLFMASDLFSLFLEVILTRWTPLLVETGRYGISCNGNV